MAQGRWNKVSRLCKALLLHPLSAANRRTIRGYLLQALCKLYEVEEAEALILETDGESNGLDSLWAKAELAAATGDRLSLEARLGEIAAAYADEVHKTRYLTLSKNIINSPGEARLSAERLTKLSQKGARQLLLSQQHHLLGKDRIPAYRALCNKFPKDPYFLGTLGHYLSTRPTQAADLDEALATAEQIAVLGCDPLPSFRIRAHALIGKYDVEAAKRLSSEIARTMGECELGVKLDAWLAAAAGEYGRAASLSALHRQMLTPPATDLRRVDLKARTGTPKNGLTDKVLLFSKMKNEMCLLPWFLNYYREIGVDWFFLVDDDSDDDTLKFLSTQHDVTTFSSSQSFSESRGGMQWINYLIRHFGTNNWCIYVDLDEQLVVPDVETQGLAPTLRQMEARGDTCMPGYMLDMSHQTEGSFDDFCSGDNPLNFSRAFTNDMFFCGSIEAGYLRAGGFGIDALQYSPRREKVPIIRGGANVEYLNAHSVTANQTSTSCAALLHFKPLRTAVDHRSSPDHAGIRVLGRSPSDIARHAVSHDLSAPKNCRKLPGQTEHLFEGSHQLKTLGLLW